MIITSFGCAALVVIISACQKRLVANGQENWRKALNSTPKTVRGKYLKIGGTV